MQLTAYVSFLCVVDALAFHEDNKARCGDALVVGQTLAELVDKCTGEGHYVFNILLTCRGNSRASYKELAKDDVLWMPRKVSALGGFTSTK